MTNHLIQYAFAAGEISARLFGRSDFEKYEMGLAEAHNWFVDYRGGLSTRPGLEFLDEYQHPEYPTRAVKFQYSPDTENTYLVLFGHGYIRFMQDGAYVTEEEKSITAITASLEVTSAGHGYAEGDLVKVYDVLGKTEVNGRLFLLSAVTTDTFVLTSISGATIDASDYAAYVSGGVVTRIYTLVNPYAAADLATVQYKQIRDTLRLTRAGYPVYDLQRFDHASWLISEAETGSYTDRPTISSHTKKTAGTAGAIYAVTAIFSDGTESVQSDNYFVLDTNNFSVEEGYVTIYWSSVAGAVAYRVYRSIILATASELTCAQELGYLGTVRGTVFSDSNYVPDFTASPPVNSDPFAEGVIEAISVTSGGSGYTSATTTVTITDPDGENFVGFPLVVSGAIVAVLISNGGRFYSSPTVVFSGTGAGAAATATVRSGSSFPQTSTIFQQRQLYAGFDNNPLGIIGSKPGQFNNFATGAIVTSGDAYDFTVSAQTVSPIRHLIDMRGGLLIMSSSAIWQLTGAGGIVTPTNAMAEPQTFFGAAALEPLSIDVEILYLTDKGSSARLLSYNDFSKIYGGIDVSILSSHLFSFANPITRWSFEETPRRLVTAVLRDGTWLSFTVVTEHKVYAWTPNSTQGFLTDSVTIEEDGRDVTYVTTKRYIAGELRGFIEQFADREFSHVEEAFCVDAGLRLAATYPDATLTVAAVSGTDVIFSADSPIFSGGDVDSIIRCGGGKAKVISFVDTATVHCRIVRDIVEVIPQTTTPRPFAAGEWTLDAPVTELSGLWHLEGATVKVITDGNVSVDKVVTAGRLSLPSPATRVVVGLGYRCQARTLPITTTAAIIEGKLRAIVGCVVRYYQTRGLKLGGTLRDLEQIKFRTTETWGEPVELKDAATFVATAHTYDLNGQTYFVQDDPLPATVLGMIFDVDVGDETA